jgi:hypothetical protein
MDLKTILIGTAGAAVVAGAVYFGRKWLAQTTDPAPVVNVEEVARRPRPPALVPGVRRARAFRMHIRPHLNEPGTRQRLDALREWHARRLIDIPPHPAEARSYRLQYALRVFPGLNNDDALDNLMQLDEAQDQYLRRQQRGPVNPRAWQERSFLDSTVQVRMLP